jgi:hypothetical protein
MTKWCFWANGIGSLSMVDIQRQICHRNGKFSIRMSDWSGMVGAIMASLSMINDETEPISVAMISAIADRW